MIVSRISYTTQMLLQIEATLGTMLQNTPNVGTRATHVRYLLTV